MIVAFLCDEEILVPSRSDWWDIATEAVEGHLTYLLLITTNLLLPTSYLLLLTSYLFLRTSYLLFVRS